MKTHFLKLTDAHTGKPMLVRADDIGAVCEGPETHQVKGARLHVRGSVLASMESVEDIEKMPTEFIEDKERRDYAAAMKGVQVAADMIESLAHKTPSGEPQTH